MVNEQFEQRMDEVIDAMEANEVPYDETSFQALSQLAFEMGQENGWVYTPDANRANQLTGMTVTEVNEEDLPADVRALIAGFREAGAEVNVVRA